MRTHTRLLTNDAAGLPVGGSPASNPQDEFVGVGLFDVARCWNLAGGFILVRAHAADVGRADAVILSAFDESLVSDCWFAQPEQPDEPWRAEDEGLGQMGCKVGGRPGFIQDSPPLPSGLDFLGQLDCESDLLPNDHKSLLCDGALYLFGRAEAGRIVEVTVIWQY